MTNTACAKEFEKDTFKAPSGKEIEIYAIKHSSMRIVFDGKEIEVDFVANYLIKSSHQAIQDCLMAAFVSYFIAETQRNNAKTCGFIGALAGIKESGITRRCT